MDEKFDVINSLQNENYEELNCLLKNLNKEVQKKIDTQIKKLSYQLCGSYLNQESGQNGKEQQVPKDFESIMNHKIDKDDLREAIKQEENKIQVAFKQIKVISEYLKQTLNILAQYSKSRIEKDGDESANQILNKKIGIYNQFQMILNKVQDFDQEKYFVDKLNN